MLTKTAQQNAASAILGGGGEVSTGKAHVPSGNRAAPSSEPKNKNSDDAVRTMQNLMVDLGVQLNKADKAQEIVARLKQENPNTQITVDFITKSALAFSRTASSASSRATAADGIWGNNTYNALLAIKNFASSLGLTDTVISEGTGPSPYKVMSDDELATKARDNIANIGRMFKSLGLSTTVANVANTATMVVVDMIDPTLPEIGITNPFGSWGSRPVMMSDLASLSSFFEFIQGLKPNFGPCKSLEELLGGPKKEESKPAITEGPKPLPKNQASVKDLANEILDSTIVRLGDLFSDWQESSGLVSIAEDIMGSDPRCVSAIDEIIKWFKDRAREMFDPLYAAYDQRMKSPRPDRKGSIGTMIDAQIGKFYINQMGKIHDAWQTIRSSVIEALKEQGNTIVTTRLIHDVVENPKEKPKPTETKGKAHQSTEGRTVTDSRGRTVSQDEPTQPPLAPFMSLDAFEEFGDLPSLNRIKKMSPGGLLPTLDLRSWTGGSWTTLAQTDVVGVDNSQKYALFGPWAAAIRDSLREAFDAWRSGDQHNYDELQKQHRLLQRWVNKINATIGTWNTEYKEQIERARKGR
jgi:hypothetical protein